MVSLLRPGRDAAVGPAVFLAGLLIAVQVADFITGALVGHQKDQTG